MLEIVLGELMNMNALNFLIILLSFCCIANSALIPKSAVEAASVAIVRDDFTGIENEDAKEYKKSSEDHNTCLVPDVDYSVTSEDGSIVYAGLNANNLTPPNMYEIYGPRRVSTLGIVQSWQWGDFQNKKDVYVDHPYSLKGGYIGPGNSVGTYYDVSLGTEINPHYFFHNGNSGGHGEVEEYKAHFTYDKSLKYEEHYSMPYFHKTNDKDFVGSTFYENNELKYNIESGGHVKFKYNPNNTQSNYRDLSCWQNTSLKFKIRLSQNSNSLIVITNNENGNEIEYAVSLGNYADLESTDLQNVVIPLADFDIPSFTSISHPFGIKNVGDNTAKYTVSFVRYEEHVIVDNDEIADYALGTSNTVIEDVDIFTGKLVKQVLVQNIGVGDLNFPLTINYREPRRIETRLLNRDLGSKLIGDNWGLNLPYMVVDHKNTIGNLDDEIYVNFGSGNSGLLVKDQNDNYQIQNNPYVKIEMEKGENEFSNQIIEWRFIQPDGTIYTFGNKELVWDQSNPLEMERVSEHVWLTSKDPASGTINKFSGGTPENPDAGTLIEDPYIYQWSLRQVSNRLLTNRLDFHYKKYNTKSFDYNECTTEINKCFTRFSYLEKISASDALGIVDEYVMYYQQKDESEYELPDELGGEHDVHTVDFVVGLSDKYLDAIVNPIRKTRVDFEYGDLQYHIASEKKRILEKLVYTNQREHSEEPKEIQFEYNEILHPEGGASKIIPFKLKSVIDENGVKTKYTYTLPKNLEDIEDLQSYSKEIEVGRVDGGQDDVPYVYESFDPNDHNNSDEPYIDKHKQPINVNKSSCVGEFCYVFVGNNMKRENDPDRLIGQAKIQVYHNRGNYISKVFEETFNGRSNIYNDWDLYTLSDEYFWVVNKINGKMKSYYWKGDRFVKDLDLNFDEKINVYVENEYLLIQKIMTEKVDEEIQKRFSEFEFIIRKSDRTFYVENNKPELEDDYGEDEGVDSENWRFEYDADEKYWKKLMVATGPGDFAIVTPEHNIVRLFKLIKSNGGKNESITFQEYSNNIPIQNVLTLARDEIPTGTNGPNSGIDFLGASYDVNSINNKNGYPNRFKLPITGVYVEKDFVYLTVYDDTPPAFATAFIALGTWDVNNLEIYEIYGHSTMYDQVSPDIPREEKQHVYPVFAFNNGNVAMFYYETLNETYRPHLMLFEYKRNTFLINSGRFEFESMHPQSVVTNSEGGTIINPPAIEYSEVDEPPRLTFYEDLLKVEFLGEKEMKYNFPLSIRNNRQRFMTDYIGYDCFVSDVDNLTGCYEEDFDFKNNNLNSDPENSIDYYNPYTKQILSFYMDDEGIEGCGGDDDGNCTGDWYVHNLKGFERPIDRNVLFEDVDENKKAYKFDYGTGKMLKKVPGLSFAFDRKNSSISMGHNVIMHVGYDQDQKIFVKFNYGRDGNYSKYQMWVSNLVETSQEIVTSVQKISSDGNVILSDVSIIPYPYSDETLYEFLDVDDGIIEYNYNLETFMFEKVKVVENFRRKSGSTKVDGEWSAKPGSAIYQFKLDNINDPLKNESRALNGQLLSVEYYDKEDRLTGKTKFEYLNPKNEINLMSSWPTYTTLNQLKYKETYQFDPLNSNVFNKYREYYFNYSYHSGKPNTVVSELEDGWSVVKNIENDYGDTKNYYNYNIKGKENAFTYDFIESYFQNPANYHGQYDDFASDLVNYVELEYDSENNELLKSISTWLPSNLLSNNDMREGRESRFDVDLFDSEVVEVEKIIQRDDIYRVTQKMQTISKEHGQFSFSTNYYEDYRNEINPENNISLVASFENCDRTHCLYLGGEGDMSNIEWDMTGASEPVIVNSHAVSGLHSIELAPNEHLDVFYYPNYLELNKYKMGVYFYAWSKYDKCRLIVNDGGIESGQYFEKVKGSETNGMHLYMLHLSNEEIDEIGSDGQYTIRISGGGDGIDGDNQSLPNYVDDIVAMSGAASFNIVTSDYMGRVTSGTDASWQKIYYEYDVNGKQYMLDNETKTFVQNKNVKATEIE